MLRMVIIIMNRCPQQYSYVFIVIMKRIVFHTMETPNMHQAMHGLPSGET